jgi:hypothetical protein
MKTVRPKPLAPDLSGLKLTPEEGFVLSRIDGHLSVKDLVALTGLEIGRVEQIVTTLASQGVVALDAAEPSGYLPEPESASAIALEAAAQRAVLHEIGDHGSTTSLADFAAALGMDPAPFGDAPAPHLDTVRDLAQVDEPTSTVQLIESEDDPDAHASLEDDSGDESGELALDDEATAPEAEADPADASAERTHRQLYETRFHPLPADARVQAARTASGDDLLALAFDADPRVVVAILENPSTGLAHARLIAQHHRTGTGLEALSRRAEYLRDIQVERRLLKNPQCGDTVLGRIMSPKRLLATYKIAIDRDLAELTRVKARGMLRQKFQSSPSEERADLVHRTEGRCLVMMTGCTFDAKTTQILCGRPYNSAIFIQNLAKFAATPPALLAHLMKQPFVRKSAPLKKLLLQHPNLPGDVKRRV